MHKTSAWPLALIYTALIVFASLFPFDGWRAQGIDPLVFLLARLPPPYWTGFDVVTNAAGYAPLGFLLVLGMLRSGWRRVLVAVAFLMGLCLIPMTTSAVEVGQPAPDFTMHSTAGESVRLADYQGKKNVMLFFFVAAFTGA